MNNLNHNDKSPVIEALTSYFAGLRQEEEERLKYALERKKEKDESFV